ncbi:MAG: T9SS type A sorting domain-containing protein, partial [Candidatus Latescibacterota bacterium]
YAQGTTMMLRFRFVSDIEDNEEGVYIDDVRIARAVSGDIVAPIPPVKQAEQGCRLYQNYPNPFNPATTIRYVLGETGPVNISVYNVQGALIRVLKDGPADSGENFVVWDGTNQNGLSVSSGVYFYRIASRGFQQTKKMVMIK